METPKNPFSFRCSFLFLFFQVSLSSEFDKSDKFFATGQSDLSKYICISVVNVLTQNRARVPFLLTVLAEDHRVGVHHVYVSVAVLTEISLRSPRKIFIFIIKQYFNRMKASQKNQLNFEKNFVD